MKKKTQVFVTAALLGLIGATSIASAQSDAPATSPEGLELIEGTKLSTVYWRPGAT